MRKLLERLNNHEQLLEVARIVKVGNNAGEEIEIDIEGLPNPIARELIQYLKACYKKDKIAERRKKRSVNEEKLATNHPQADENVLEKLDSIREADDNLEDSFDESLSDDDKDENQNGVDNPLKGES